MKRNHRRYRFPDGSNYAIVEASNGLTLPVQTADVKKGVTHDPEHCALAVCAERMGFERAFVAGTVAYVVMPFDGETVAVKYTIPTRTRRAIKLFDETGGMPAEGFMFAALQRNVKSAEKKKANAKRKGSELRWTGKTGGDREALRSWRYLTGQVHTTPDD